MMGKFRAKGLPQARGPRRRGVQPRVRQASLAKRQAAWNSVPGPRRAEVASGSAFGAHPGCGRRQFRRAHARIKSGVDRVGDPGVISARLLGSRRGPRHGRRVVDRSGPSAWRGRGPETTEERMTRLDIEGSHQEKHTRQERFKELVGGRDSLRLAPKRGLARRRQRALHRSDVGHRQR